MSIESVMLSSHLILCHPVLLLLQSFPASVSFPMSRRVPTSRQSTVASAQVLPLNIQGWFPLELTGLISLLSNGFSRVFSSTAIGRHQFFSAQPSFCSISHIHTWLLEEDLHVWWPESSRGFFTYVLGACLGELQVGLSWDYHLRTNMWPLHVARASPRLKAGSQEGETSEGASHITQGSVWSVSITEDPGRSCQLLLTQTWRSAFSSDKI